MPLSDIDENVQDSNDVDKKYKQFWFIAHNDAVVRKSARLQSERLTTIKKGSHVLVDAIEGRRAHIVSPLDGWCSLQTSKGIAILLPDKNDKSFSNVEHIIHGHENNADLTQLRGSVIQDLIDGANTIPPPITNEFVSHNIVDNNENEARSYAYVENALKNNSGLENGFANVNVISDSSDNRGENLDDLPRAKQTDESSATACQCKCIIS